MKGAFRSAEKTPPGMLIQRADNGRVSTAAGPERTAPSIDIDDLVERVYRRWQDELRRERERGAW